MNQPIEKQNIWMPALSGGLMGAWAGGTVHDLMTRRNISQQGKAEIKKDTSKLKKIKSIRRGF